jgi:hypothetical protein
MQTSRTRATRAAVAPALTPSTARATPPVKAKAADGFDLGSSDLGKGVEGQLKAWVGSIDPAKVVSSAGLQPFDMLKEVQSGDLSLTMPMNAGSLAGGLVSVKPGTVMKLSADAKNGQLNPSDIHVSFVPPLDGPLWTSVPGAYVTSEGDIKVDVSGAPDLTIGPKLPRGLSALADTLNGVVKKGSVGFDIFGIPLGSVPVDPSSGGSGLVQLDKVQMSVKNATFNGNTLSLGKAGQIALGKDSTMDIEGSLSNLSVKGHVDVTRLSLEQDGVKLDGGAGSADLNLNLAMDANGKGKVTAAIDNLNVACQHAVSTRTNGDFISLADGQLQNGSIRLEQDFQVDKKSGKVASTGTTLSSLDVGNFAGTVEGAQLTVPDADGNATVKVGRSSMSGDLNVTPGGIVLDGQLDGHAEIQDYQGKEQGTPLDVKDLTIDGKGGLHVGPSGLKLDPGSYTVDSVLNDAKLSLPGLLDFDLAQGAHVHSTVTDATVGAGGIAADFAPGTTVNAALDKGTIHLPVVGDVQLGKGSNLTLDCDSLSYDSHGFPAASGTMSVTADITKDQVDLSALKNIPGVQITSVDGVHLLLHIDIGRFTIAKDGTFSLHDVNVGVSGNLGDVTGKLGSLAQA